MPSWPNKGSIALVYDFLVLKMGQYQRCEILNLCKLGLKHEFCNNNR